LLSSLLIEVNAMPEATRRQLKNRIPPRAGVGLKAEHYMTIMETVPDVGFFEVHAENYMGAGGPPHRYLAAIRELYPIALHGVGLSIGAVRPLDRDHLKRLKLLIDRYEPGLFSEHLAWSSHEVGFLNDLLPLPYTNEMLGRVVEHIDQVQEFVGRQMLLENPTTYLAFTQSNRDEAGFIAEVASRTGCGLLLDINNVHAACTNQNWDPIAYLDAFPLSRVAEIHLAGCAPDIDEEGGLLLIDAHDRPVSEIVWDLFLRAVEQIGPIPTLIEWDANIPAWPVLAAEAQRADRILTNTDKSLPVEVLLRRSALEGSGGNRDGCNKDEGNLSTRSETIPATRGIRAPPLGRQAQGMAGRSLADQQADFARAILDPFKPVPSNVVSASGWSGAKRFAVYRNNVVLGLIEALKAAYPVVHRLVGDVFFSAMARLYVMAEPPNTPVMLDYGASFPAFVQTFEPASMLGYLPDVARLERLWVEAYHAPEASPLPPATLGEISRDHVPMTRLVLHPSVRTLRSPFPIVSIWQANIGHKDVGHVDLDACGDDVLVVRPEAEVEVRRLPAGAAAFIGALRAGSPIFDAANDGLSAKPDFDLASALLGMVEANLIIGFNLEPVASQEAA
jgi:uncharacterized protein (UPF0276 family)